MKPATTVQLRLVGIMPAHVLMSLVAAVPIVQILWVTFVRKVPYAWMAPGTTALAAGLALLPWMWRAFARMTYRAKCDEVAVHVKNEALPYKTIKEVRVEETKRRKTLHLIRSEDIKISLVLWDAYAGRLEPIEALKKRLAEHNLTF